MENNKNQLKKVEKNQEVETKIILPDDITFADVEEFLGVIPHEPWKDIAMEADYLDTVDNDLQKIQVAYRLRKENDDMVATLKAGKIDANGVAHRYEVNVEVNSMVPDLSVFYQDEKFGAILKTLEGKEMKSLLTMDFYRLASIYTFESAKIEVAIDRGFMEKDGEMAPIWELELELKEGLVEDMLRFQESILGFFQLEVSKESKYQRGLAL